MSTQPIRFGERLSQVLESLQPPRNQAWLAEMAQLERSTISRLVRGERSPTLDTVQAIAPFLGMTVEELLRGTDAEVRIMEEAETVRSDWGVRREDYDAVVQKLVDYEGRLHDLERKARAAQDAQAQEEQKRKMVVMELQEKKLHLERLEWEMSHKEEQVRALEAELQRYREALHKAVAEVSSLRANLKILAEEVKSNTRSSRTAAILAGAALVGVVTAATYLGNNNGQEKADEREPSRGGRRTKTQHD